MQAKLIDELLEKDSGEERGEYQRFGAEKYQHEISISVPTPIERWRRDQQSNQPLSESRL